MVVCLGCPKYIFNKESNTNVCLAENGCIFHPKIIKAVEKSICPTCKNNKKNICTKIFFDSEGKEYRIKNIKQMKGCSGYE